MDRLTPNDLNKVCFDTWELCGLDSVCKRDCWKPTKCKIPGIVYRLGEYEDTGLEPQEIATIRAGLERATRERDEAIADMIRVAYRQSVMPCAVCRHEGRAVLVGGEIDKTSPCFGCCEIKSAFEWRKTEVDDAKVH